jgi:hypothetical protein
VLDLGNGIELLQEIRLLAFICARTRQAVDYLPSRIHLD